ncbi:MAG: helix-turn-helix transcriptional regulator [Lentisphaerae bacterium]|jgi:AraC-like DNA-binding protein|nr:helix-turn-helix transcriptional regulator [Lentisphaerota bacterium]OQC16593.1 MAG: Exoenzyme S synthesis regulatory protein ExsA [Lentisphaerae bacterium ADurb.Bin082]
MSNNGKFNIAVIEPELPRLRISCYSFILGVANWGNPNRAAPFWRLYWNATEGAELHWEGRCMPLSPDSLTLIPAYTSYASAMTKAFDQFFIHFHPGKFFERIPRRPLTLNARDFMPVLKTLRNDFAHWTPLLNVKIYGLLMSVMWVAAQEFAEDRPGTALDSRILKAIAIMNRKYKISNRELAQNCNMSLDNFLRLFKKEFGMTPQRYLMCRRMEYAQSRLAEPDADIAAIALETGFTDRYQFSKAFKKFFNISPGRSRNRPPADLG